MKRALYYIRIWLRDLVRYPREIISTADEGDSYDEYWEKRGRVAGEKLSNWQKDRARIIVNAIEQGGGVDSIGDLGSGNGAVLEYLREQLRVSRVVAYEISPKALASLEQAGIPAVLFDARREEDFEKIERASYLLLLEVLEHLHDPEHTLDQVLKKAELGVFFSVPNTGFMTHRFRLLFGKVPLQWQRHPSEHVRFWTVVDMKWWLRTLGHANFTITPYRGVPFLNRLWPNVFAEGMVVFIPKKHV